MADPVAGAPRTGVVSRDPWRGQKVPDTDRNRVVGTRKRYPYKKGVLTLPTM
jgi:hypothetical protein